MKYLNNFHNRYLTCVEYYILKSLNEKMDIRMLYYDSYISANSILKKSFNSTLSAIQDILIKHEYLSLKVTKELCFEQLSNPNNINLILINKDFSDDKKYRIFIDRHYVQIQNYNHQYYLINSYPEGTERVCVENIIKYYNGKSLIYSFKKSKKIKKTYIIDQIKKKLKKEKWIEIKSIKHIERLQKLLQILKVSRYRIYDLCCYLKRNKLAKTIFEIIKEYENMFLKISLMIYKKQNNQDLVLFIIQQINQNEKKIYQLLKKEFLYE